MNATIDQFNLKRLLFFLHFVQLRHPLVAREFGDTPGTHLLESWLRSSVITQDQFLAISDADGGVRSTGIDRMIGWLEEAAIPGNRLHDAEGADPGPLVEQIAALLRSPHASNYLSGRVLEQLRRAVLRPDEIQKVVAELGEKRFRCYRCSRLLDWRDEYVMVIRTPDGFACFNCAIPTAMSCGVPGCESPTNVRPLLERIHRKGSLRCKKHQKAEPKAPEVADGGILGAAQAVPPVVNFLDEILDRPLRRQLRNPFNDDPR